MTDTDTQTELDAMPANREEQFAALFKRLDVAWGTSVYDDDGEPEDLERTIDESILAVEKTRGFEVTISTGGPGEWLECTVDEDGSVDRVHFVCAWWSTPQKTVVHEDSGLWRLADRMNPYQYE